MEMHARVFIPNNLCRGRSRTAERQKERLWETECCWKWEIVWAIKYTVRQNICGRCVRLISTVIKMLLMMLFPWLACFPCESTNDIFRWQQGASSIYSGWTLASSSKGQGFKSYGRPVERKTADKGNSRFDGQNDNTCKDFTYNINKCNFTNMFFNYCYK